MSNFIGNKEIISMSIGNSDITSFSFGEQEIWTPGGDEPIPTSASLFTFNDNTVTGYVGTDTNVVIPRSYSRIPGTPIITPGTKCYINNPANWGSNATNPTSTLWNNINSVTCTDGNKTIKYTNGTDFIDGIKNSTDFNNWEEVYVIEINCKASSGRAFFSAGSGSFQNNIVKYPFSFYYNNETWTYSSYTATSTEQDKSISYLFTTVGYGNSIELAGATIIPYQFVDGDDYQVTTVGATFQNNDIVERVTILDNINTILANAFKGCTNLVRLDIPYTVTSMDNSMIESILNTVDIYFSGTVNQWIDIYTGSENSWIDNYNLYINNKLLTDLTVTGVSSLYRKFTNCLSLISVYIGSDVTFIQPGAFGGCLNLTSIIVDPNNKYYDSRNNCNAINETKTNTLISGCSTSVIPSTIFTIGTRAFERHTEITNIYIPNNIFVISDYAFSNTGLTDITISMMCSDVSSTAFRNCPWVTLHLNTYYMIEYNSFYQNPNIENVEYIYVPNNLISDYISRWGNYITDTSKFVGFEPDIYEEHITTNSNDYYLTYLLSDRENKYEAILVDSTADTSGNPTILNIPQTINANGKVYTVIEILYYAQSILTRKVALDNIIPTVSEIHIPHTIKALPTGIFDKTEILNKAYIDCENYISSKTTLVGEPLGHINYNTGNNCSIYFENHITNLPDNICSNNLTVDAIEFNSSLRSIGKQAFLGTSISEITLGENITYIGEGAFANCPNLNNIEIFNNSNYVLQNNYLLTVNDNILLVAVPYNENAIPVGTTRIGNYCFYRQQLPNFLELPNTLESIGEEAFSMCSGVEEIILPATLSYIGYQSFSNALSLSTITCHATTPPAVDRNLANSISLTAIYVPENSVDDYKISVGWSKYADIIQAIPQE